MQAPGICSTAQTFGKLIKISLVDSMAHVVFIFQFASMKECTRINYQDITTIHHEMGHIICFMLYQHQPAIYREAPNDGFHEAIGEMIGLSVISPKYLKQIGLMNINSTSKATRINSLFRLALDKIPVIPFIYALESFRYAVFRGEVKPEEYNCKYWELMLEKLGVTPPVQRYAEDFDPPAKYHIATNTEYAR